MNLISNRNKIVPNDNWLSDAFREYEDLLSSPDSESITETNGSSVENVILNNKSVSSNGHESESIDDGMKLTKPIANI